MKREHLSEVEIQQYVLDKNSCESNIVLHMLSCEHCQAVAASYELLFSTIKQDPKPAFEFDLETFVIAQLPEPRSKFSWSNLLLYVIILLGSSSIGFSIYLFRAYFAGLFIGISSTVLYLTITTALTVMVFQIIEMYKKHQRHMRVLDNIDPFATLS